MSQLRWSNSNRVIRVGFTLIESIATIVVLGILGSGTSMIIHQAVDGYSTASTSVQLHAEASVAFDRIVREIRKIALDTGASGIAPDIDSVTAASIAWASNNSLTFSGGQITLVENGGSSQVLINEVTGLVIQTYNESNSALASSLTGTQCDSIRRVEVTLTLLRAGVTETLRTKVFLRSTMTGAAAP